MIIRIILILFTSLASGVCYLAGYARLTSSLLVGFGSLVSFFFGVLFLLPEEQRNLWFPVYGTSAVWPYMVIGGILAFIAYRILVQKWEKSEDEPFSSDHLQYLAGGALAYIFTIFIASYFWFPSDERRLEATEPSLLLFVYIGTGIYLAGTLCSLFLLYKASRGVAKDYPDMMRKIVLAVFAVFHFDKFPPFIAFLLIYSPETQIIYPHAAALALAAYIPVSLFLAKLSRKIEYQPS